jgi:galactose mutarotase-like enzyme
MALPDAVNHAEFPSIVMQAGELYVQKTVYEFL